MSCPHVFWPSLALLVLASPTITLAQGTNRYAVLVGINQYQHEKLPPLKYAEADVTETAELLRQAGYQVTLLTGSARDEASQPTKANIEQQLRAVLAKCRKGDTVVLGFAGHGLQFEGQQDCFFCPADARPLANRTDSLVSLSKVYEELDASFAGMKVLLVDACRDDPMGGRGTRGIDADAAPRPPQGVAALFSCRAGERAFEHEKRGHGIFFYHVLKGLQGEAKDADGEITFASLASYVSRRVSRDVAELIGGGAKQSPNLKADYSAEPILLAPKDLAGTTAEQLYQRGIDLLQGRGGVRDPVAAAKLIRQAAEAGLPVAQYRLGSLYLSGYEAVPIDNQEGVKWTRRAAENGYAIAQVALAFWILEGKWVPKDESEAQRWLSQGSPGTREAAQLGDPAAQVQLGRLYQSGNGVSKDDVEAVNWYRKAAEQGYAAAQGYLALMYVDGRGVVKDEVEAVKWYRKAAEQGNAPVQNNLGNMYANGRGVANDDVEAVKWFRKAAEQGYANGQCGLGFMYANGRGVAKDDTEAVKWYRKAAEQGNAPAQSNLGFMYERGRGVTTDDAEAVKWYRKAADQGGSYGQNNLGFMYANGRGVAKDDTEAVKWYRKAAEQGNDLAQFNLGNMYLNGRGVAKDDVEAVKWYRQAAEQGHATAQCNLAWMYENGRGVAKDDVEAVKWYRQAAEQGIGRAENNLGVMYESGRGVAKDVDEAVKWYRTAAAHNYEPAKQRLQQLGM